jgi:hypothetical protein
MTIDDARIQRLKDQAAKELNAGEKFIQVNPGTVIVLCDLALKTPPRTKVLCPSCGKSVEGSWTDGVANCRSCSWRGPYPTMEAA